MLKAHTYFQICQNNSGPFCKCCFSQSDMGKNACKICKADFTQMFDLLLSTSIFCYATRTFARLEIICITLICEEVHVTRNSFTIKIKIV